MDSYRKLLEWIKGQVGSIRFPNQSKMAEMLEVKSKTTLYETLKDRTVPRADEFLRWLDVMGVRFLMPNEYEKLCNEFYPVPKVKARLAGDLGGSLETEDDIESFYSFRYEWLNRGKSPTECVLMEVVGESMEPTLHQGDMVLIDQSQKEVWAGKIYAVGLEDTIVVKRLEKLPGKLVLRSDNPGYEPIHLDLNQDANYRILGRVVWAAREFF